MSDINKYIGESQLTEKPAKVLKIKIVDGAITSDKIAEAAVTTSKIAKGAVTVNTLGEDVQLAIEGVERAGLLVSQEFGSSKVIGISQNAITNAFESLSGEYYEY